jgi:hypothetical protein
MKRAFLVPAAVAVSALSPNAEAAVPTVNASAQPAETQGDASLAAKRAVIEASQKPISSYAVGDSLFGFVLERNDAGQVVADHYSHSSHSSHASHASGS